MFKMCSAFLRAVVKRNQIQTHSRVVFLPLTLVLSPFKQYLTHTTEDGDLILLPSVRLC